MRRTFLLIMLVAALLLASTGVVLAQQSAAPADARSAVEPPTIVNGQPADPGEYPAQGFLLIETSPGNFSACGGTLVDTVHFLTAAHCVTDDSGNEFSAGSFQITLGEVDLNAAGPEDRYGVSGVEAHENWNPDTDANDVAMLTLDDRADFTPTRVVEANETNL